MPTPRACSTCVAARTARLAASYIAAGFVHGVLNSDNIAITGESFDYGPWRWTPDWDGLHRRLFRPCRPLFLRPPARGDPLGPVQLAGSLRAIAEADALADRSTTLPRRFEEALREALFARLGIAPRERRRGPRAGRRAIESAAVARGRDRPLLLRLARRARPAADDAYADRDAVPSARAPARGPRRGALDHPYWSDPGPCSMHIDEVEAIWAAIDERDDWAPFDAKIAAVRRMGEAMRGDAAA